MQAQFHDSPKLSKDILLPLMQRRNGPAFLQFFVLLVCFLGTSTWIVLAWDSAWWNMALSYLIFGTLVCSTFAGLHETAHNTAFQSRRWNRIAASVLGVLHFYPASIFRALHFTHHRHTHQPGMDPEITLAGKPAPSTIGSLPMYLGWLTGLPLLLFKLGMITMCAIGLPEAVRKRLYPFIRPKERAQVVPESLLVLATHTGIALLALLVHPGFWGILIGQCIGHAFLAAYLIMEHNGLPHEGDIMKRTRSIQAPVLLKRIMWNMPYHAEHHAYPAVPFYALPALHQELKPEILHGEEGHLKFHLKIVRKLFSGK